MDTGAVRAPAVARHLAIDEQGTLLRATWRPELGFVNLSLWRGDTCVETFHMSPHEAAALMSFLATSLADSVPPPTGPALSLVPDRAARTPVRSRGAASTLVGSLGRAVRSLRAHRPRAR
jgi:hypothetical protein